MKKIGIIVSNSAMHLGLFDDLKDNNQVVLITAELKNINNRFLSFLRNICLSSKLNFLNNHLPKSIWYKYSIILNRLHKFKSILIFGTALNEVEYDFISHCRKKNVPVYLYLIDSLDASSPRMITMKKKIFSYPWNEIFTFDKQDAEKYGFTYRGFDYYSATKRHAKVENLTTDIFFVGGLKGNRTTSIINTYKHLASNGIKCNFKVMEYNKKTPLPDGISKIVGGWIPYSQIIKSLDETNCILDIAQEMQHGASLRYFEAICYNKKLLSNNPEITTFPYFNSKYMKVFKDVSDIELTWLQSRDYIDYGVEDDVFSPKNLLNYLIRK